ncbi:MAG TPA: HAD family hydrolase, partial [Planctomycetota bacterium]|nr:HAD family hydrolase [Planctomycetota bacterium]
MLRSSAVGEARSPAESFRGRTAILFDLDGTLYGGPALAPFFAHVDAVTGLRVRALVGESDPARAFDAIERLRAGDPALRSKSDVLERRFGIGLAEMNRFRERFTDVEAYVTPDPRAARLLRGLAKERALALGTNNAPRLARRLLARLGVDPSTFAAILT